MASFMIRLSGGALLCVPVMMAQAAGTEQTAHSQKRRNPGGGPRPPSAMTAAPKYRLLHHQTDDHGYRVAVEH
jgi:hypothetical protein